MKKKLNKKKLSTNTSNEIRNCIITSLVTSILTIILSITASIIFDGFQKGTISDFYKLKYSEVGEITWKVQNELNGENKDLTNWLNECIRTGEVKPIIMSQKTDIDFSNLFIEKEIQISDIKFDWFAFKYNISETGFWSYMIYDYLEDVSWIGCNERELSVDIKGSEKLSTIAGSKRYEFVDLCFGNVSDYNNLVIACVFYLNIDGITKPFLVSEYKIQTDYDYNVIENYNENLRLIIENIWVDRHKVNRSNEEILTGLVVNQNGETYFLESCKNFRFIVTPNILNSGSGKQ